MRSLYPRTRTMKVIIQAAIEVITSMSSYPSSRFMHLPDKQAIGMEPGSPVAMTKMAKQQRNKARNITMLMTRQVRIVRCC